MFKGSKLFKDSTTFSTPQNYVTVQLRNKKAKKKYNHHRSSVLHQIQATQSILNESLTKQTPQIKSALSSPKHSHFQLKKKIKESDFSYFLKSKEKILEENRKDVKPEFKYRICEEIQNKIKQITNISYHFDRACAQRAKKLKTQTVELSQKYTLQNLHENKDVSQLKNAIHQKKIPKNWIRKLRNGKSLVEKMKKKLSLIKFQKYVPVKSEAKMNQKMQQREAKRDNQGLDMQMTSIRQISFRDFYFRKQEERKSAPISSKNTFFKLFCSVKGNQSHLFRQRIEVQAEEVRKLQQFVRGVEASQFKEYDNLVHMSEFIKDTQNFKVLKRMYNYVKEKYAYQFKEMEAQSIKEPNLLSLVYYLQNKSNMTEQEKKTWKAKMKFID